MCSLKPKANCLLFDGLPEMYHIIWSNNEGGTTYEQS